MPELPEVETVRRGLNEKLTGRTIVGVDVYLNKIIKAPNVAEFKQILPGKRVESVRRKGKYLIIDLTEDYVLVMHMRMTGRFDYVPAGTELRKSTFIVFKLDNGYDLHFSDPRQFATVHLLPVKDIYTITGLATLGPEPISDDFTFADFKAKLVKRQGKIKNIILDQRVMAGIGNIYADESLFAAGIDPERPANSLTEEEQLRLYHAIRANLEAGILHRGTSVQSYFDVEGRKGEHQEYLKVYRRLNKPCVKCGKPIMRKEVAGRGTYYCPHCQH